MFTDSGATTQSAFQEYVLKLSNYLVIEVFLTHINLDASAMAPIILQFMI